MRNAVITGGAGFLGAALGRALLPETRITVIDTAPAVFDSNVKFVRKDIRESVEAHFEDVDCVFHYAARTTFPGSVQAPQLDAEVNILGTVNILEACRKKDVPKVVFASSSAVYGIPKRVPIREDDPLLPVNFYGLSKKVCEEYVELYRNLYGIETVSLRPFNIYGKHQNPKAVIPQFIKKIQDKEKIRVYGDGSDTRDFIHVDDVVRASILAALNPCSGAINVGTGIETSIAELLEVFRRLCGEIEVIYEPKKEGSITRSVADTEKAKKVIGFQSIIGLEDGIRSCLR